MGAFRGIRPLVAFRSVLLLLAAGLSGSVSVAAGDAGGAPPPSAHPSIDATSPSRPGESVSDEAAIATVWTRFVGALRRGDMDAARECYAEPSRAVMPPEAFAAQHHPATAYGRLLVATGGGRRIEVQDNRAVLHRTPRGDGTAAGATVSLFLVREGGAWAFVTPARWQAATLEAQTRRLLVEFRELLRPVLREVGHERAREVMRRRHADWFSSPRYRQVSAQYAIAWEATSSDAWIVRARPRDVASGLRPFTLDPGGVVRAAPAAPTGPVGNGEE
jgi:hypothetical protein